MRLRLLIAVVMSVWLSGSVVNASEPPYCDPASFGQLEVANPVGGLVRAHVFKIGNLTIAGLGIGKSPVSGTKALAQHFSAAGAGEGFCTWYTNDGNDQAAQTFNYDPLPHPRHDSDADVYMARIGGAFDQAPENFLSCAEKFGFISVGCDGMRHRGPTVFGMLLAYSGCTPEHADAIANKIWGLNGIPDHVRTAIIRRGAELGASHVAQSGRFRNHLLGITQ